MYYWEDGAPHLSAAADGSEVHHSSVRARAAQTLNELKGMMQNEGGFQGDPETLVRTIQPRHLAYDEGVPQSDINREASLKLRELLSRQTSPIKVPGDVPATGAAERVLPTPQEASLMLQSHVRHSQQLEAENNYLKEELRAMKAKMMELLGENERLHEELRSSVLHEILQEGGTLSSQHLRDGLSEEVFEQVAYKSAMAKWKHELARLHELHDAKSSQLEAQLASAKVELARYERVVDELKSQLRMEYSNVATREDGSIDGFMRQSAAGAQKQTVVRLQRERDELVETVSSLRVRMRECGEREEAAYLQVKKGIELVEQAQLEQTEALVGREQLQSQLENTQRRFIEHTKEMTHKVEVEKEAVRSENKVVVDDLNNKIREVTEQLVMTQQKLEKVVRDRKRVSKELEECKSEMKLTRREATQLAMSQRTETSNCSLIRQHSQQEVTRLRTELAQSQKQIDQERSRLRVEKSELHRRLEEAERELVNTKEECLQTTSLIQSVERELHFAKMTKESVEQCRKADLTALSRRSEQKEGELNGLIEGLHSKHENVEGEMDEILNKQNRLIEKLRDECQRQTTQLAKVTHKYRSEVGTVRRDNDLLRQKLDRITTRGEEAAGLNEQHTKVQGKMKQRLVMMDEHGQRQAQQILDMLSTQAELMRQRQALAKEVELLRSKMLSHPQSSELMATNRPIATSMAAIDGILSSVTKDEVEAIKDQYRPPPSLNIDELL